MQIDKYIAELVKLRQAHGPELEVVTLNPQFKKAPLPRLAYARNDKRAFFAPDADLDKYKGEKVVRV